MTGFIALLAAAIGIAAEPVRGSAPDAPAYASSRAPGDSDGVDGAAYGHAGYEDYAYSGGIPLGAPAYVWEALVAGSFRARFRRVQAGLGAFYEYTIHSPAEHARWTQYRSSAFLLGLDEAWLRLLIGVESDFRIGLMRLRGNPDAVLFGNYLARHDPYSNHQERARWQEDTLGAVSGHILGAAFAIGSADAPLRAEAWVIEEQGVFDDTPDFSVIGYLSGTAPRKFEWGLGLGLYRTLAGRDPLWHFTYDDTSVVDTMVYTLGDFLLSARFSLDLAALWGADAPEGRYGGLFAEAALLGARKKPTSDPRLLRRTAWTAGLRLPTFGLLDELLAQAEWWPGPPGESPWSYGGRIVRRLGRRLEAQARVEHGGEIPRFDGYFLSESYRLRYARATRMSARLVVRLP